MRKNSGFTLIELMVVMAIIAILATAGISAYGGYIKKARDTKRIQDLSAIESVIVSSLSVSGIAPTFSNLLIAIENANNGTLLIDPLNQSPVCLDGAGGPEICEYVYGACEDGGFLLRARFESSANEPKYIDDKLQSSGLVNRSDYYDIGSCNAVDINGENIIQ